MHNREATNDEAAAVAVVAADAASFTGSHDQDGFLINLSRENELVGKELASHTTISQLPQKKKRKNEENKLIFQTTVTQVNRLY